MKRIVLVLSAAVFGLTLASCSSCTLCKKKPADCADCQKCESCDMPKKK